METAFSAAIAVITIGLAIGAFTKSLIRGKHDPDAGEQPGIKNHPSR